MYQLIIGSLTLSLIHALIPNHWLPLIAIAKAEKWTQKRTLWATAITGFVHTLSTITLGIFVGLAGYTLSEKFESVTGIFAPSILILLGIVYVIYGFRAHSHKHSDFHLKEKEKRNWIATLVSLSIAMFLSPCIEITAYYFQAGTIGWSGIIALSAVYLVTTVLMMLLLVYLGLKGVSTFKSRLLEQHDKTITGMVLIILGLLSFLISV